MSGGRGPGIGPRGALVLGAGDMGGRHARAWAAAGVPVVAVVDPDLERARGAAAPLGAAALATPEEGWALAGVDVVSVCTPTFLHPDFTIAALQAGKHVLCEKPVALRMADAQRMARAAEASGRQLRIGFMRRFQPAFGRLATAVGTLGAPVLAQANISAGVRPKRLMHDADANGGPIIDMCCHLFDQWEALFGASLSVRAFGHTFGADKPELAGIRRLALDSAAITLAYPGGTVGQIQVSWGLPAGSPVIEQHRYLGPRGQVEVAWPDRVVRTSGAASSSWDAPATDPWRDEIAAFAAELRGGDALTAPARVDDGIRALRTSLAVLASVAGEREIDLRGAVGADPCASA